MGKVLCTSVFWDVGSRFQGLVVNGGMGCQGLRQGSRKRLCLAIPSPRYRYRV